MHSRQLHRMPQWLDLRARIPMRAKRWLHRRAAADRADVGGRAALRRRADLLEPQHLPQSGIFQRLRKWHDLHQRGGMRARRLGVRGRGTRAHTPAAEFPLMMMRMKNDTEVTGTSRYLWR